MAQYLVTGAMVQVDTVASDGTPVLVYRYRGDLVELSDAQAEHLTSVGLVEKPGDVKSDPVVNPAAGLVGVQAVEVAGKPTARDAKPVWVAWAVRNGLSEDDANKATKADLVAIFGDNDDEVPALGQEPAVEETPVDDEPPADPPADPPVAPPVDDDSK